MEAEGIVSNFYLAVHKLGEYDCIGLVGGGGKSFPERIMMTQQSINIGMVLIISIIYYGQYV